MMDIPADADSLLNAVRVSSMVDARDPSATGIAPAFRYLSTMHASAIRHSLASRLNSERGFFSQLGVVAAQSHDSWRSIVENYRNPGGQNTQLGDEQALRILSRMLNVNIVVIDERGAPVVYAVGGADVPGSRHTITVVRMHGTNRHYLGTLARPTQPGRHWQ